MGREINRAGPGNGGGGGWGSVAISVDKNDAAAGGFPKLRSRKV